MTFEFLVEDISGKEMLERILPTILDAERDAFRVHSYKGIGRLPKGLKAEGDPRHRILLLQLPRLLAGYGKASQGHPVTVVVVCDADQKDPVAFREELEGLRNACTPCPDARFCIAVEEGEAWLLGDRAALLAAYPRAKIAHLDRYKQDSVCGTWELLADAVEPGGRDALIKRGYHEIGASKCKWAREIAPHMRPDRNLSPSFRGFLDGCGSPAARRGHWTWRFWRINK